MSERKKPHLPIGYWLKKADELLTSRINQVQEVNGLSRTEWQVLNMLYETTGASKLQIIEILHPFGDCHTLGQVIEGLVKRGFVEGDEHGNGQLRLTARGLAVHAAALEVQEKVRQQAVQGISERDYATTVRVLQQIVANLTDGEG